MYKPTIIRFWRKGAKYYPVYDIVVTWRSKRLRGSFLELLGHYNPQSSEKLFFINGARLGYWLNHGAKLHPRVGKHLPAVHGELMASVPTIPLRSGKVIAKL